MIHAAGAIRLINAYLEVKAVHYNRYEVQPSPISRKHNVMNALKSGYNRTKNDIILEQGFKPA